VSNLAQFETLSLNYMDFTLTTYKKLLQELFANCYSFQTLQDYTKQPENKTVILRHDEDNALILG